MTVILFALLAVVVGVLLSAAGGVGFEKYREPAAAALGIVLGSTIAGAGAFVLIVSIWKVLT